MTTKQMKKALLDRLDGQFDAFRSTVFALQSVDDMEDCYLHDQMDTATELMVEMEDLLVRMRNVVGE